VVMELADGGDLAAVIARNARARTRMREAQLLGYFVQLLAALAHVHALGVIHRDVKASNVLLTAQQSLVKLGDFGISKVRVCVSGHTVCPHCVATCRSCSWWRWRARAVCIFVCPLLTRAGGVRRVPTAAQSRCWAPRASAATGRGQSAARAAAPAAAAPRGRRRQHTAGRCWRTHLWGELVSCGGGVTRCWQGAAPWRVA
jgi:serine/threonine protein kinase